MPEVGSAMLDGITRRSVIEFLEEEKIPIRSERIDRSMVYTCDELILTGTAAQVMHAHSVDGRRKGDRPWRYPGADLPVIKAGNLPISSKNTPEGIHMGDRI